MLRQITKTILLLLIIFTAFNAKAQQSDYQTVPVLKESFWLNSKSAKFINSSCYTRGVRTVELPKGTVSIVYRVTVLEKKKELTPFAQQINQVISTAAQNDPYALTAKIIGQAITNSDGSYADFFIFPDANNAHTFFEGEQPDNKLSVQDFRYKTISIVNALDKIPSNTLYFGFRNNNMGSIMGTGGLQIDLEVVALVEKIKNGGWTQETLNLFKAGLMKQPDISILPERDRLSNLIVYATSQKYTFQELSQSKAQDNVELGYREIVINAKKMIAVEKQREKKDALKLYNQAAQLIKEKKFADALHMAEYVISKGQKNNITLNLYGYSLLLTKQFTKAKKILKDAALIDPTDLYVQGNLASAYLLTNEFENAKAIYLQYANENIDANTSFKQGVKEDFELFKEIGIVSLDFQKIYDLIGIK